MFPRGVKHNLRYYTWYYALSGLIFPVPIWVAFYTQVITLPQLAMINALESLITLALEVPTGALADLLGRRTTIILGSILLCVFFFSVPFVHNFNAILILSIASGTGSALISGSDSALLYDSLKEVGRENEIGKIYSKLGFYYRIAIVIATLLAGYMFTIWRGIPHIARGVVTLLAGFAIWLAVEPTIDSQKFTLVSYLKQTQEGVKELTKSHYLKIISIYYVIVAGITFSCLAYFNQPFAYDFGYSPLAMSYITSASYLITSLMLLYLTNHEELLTRRRIYLGFPILMAISLLPGLWVNRTFALLIMMGAQLAGSARFSILDKYMNKEFSSKNRATALSTLNMGVSLMMALLVFLGGQVQGFSDTRHAYTYLGILTLIFVVPLSFSLINEHNRYHAAKLITK